MVQDAPGRQVVAPGGGCWTDLHGGRSLARIGIALGLGRPADRSVPQNSLKRLRDRQVLIQTDTGVYRYEDETFRDWVLTEHLAKSP